MASQGALIEWVIYAVETEIRTKRLKTINCKMEESHFGIPDKIQKVLMERNAMFEITLCFPLPSSAMMGHVVCCFVAFSLVHLIKTGECGVVGS